MDGQNHTESGHPILDLLVFAPILTGIIGALNNYSGVFVSLSALIGAAFGIYRFVTLYSDRKAIKKRQTIVNNSK